jgi:Cu+-exporting ATPase
MNGLLAWTQSTGMPMRPAMSTMMTADIPPTDAGEQNVQVRLTLAPGARAGRPTRVRVLLTDPRTGRAVTDLGRSHAVWMHLIATREDLGTFAHLHPEPTGQAGEYAVTTTFPTPGRYVINTEFRRRGDMGDLHDRQVVTVPGPTAAAIPLHDTARSQVVGGVRVELQGNPRAGVESELRFVFSDPATGEPVRSLKPYLVAAGHIVIMRSGAETFAHEHADVRDDSGRPVFALPGQRFGPELPVHAHFDAPGTYRLWGQFRLADDRVITVPFTVTAR